MDYLVNGGDEADLAKAEAEYTAGALGLEIEENEKLRAEIERLRAAGKAIIAANDEFRAIMPPDWESDSINDACEAARALFSDNEQTTTTEK